MFVLVLKLMIIEISGQFLLDKYLRDYQIAGKP